MALGLLFDLASAFALVQAVAVLYEGAHWRGVFEAVLVMWILWFSWTGFVRVGVFEASARGRLRIAGVAAIGAVIVVSLAVPGAFGGKALLFGAALVVLRGLEIIGSSLVERPEPSSWATEGRLAGIRLAPVMVLVVAALLPGTGRWICWLGAVALDAVAVRFSGGAGRAVSSRRFAERHSVITIVVLGAALVTIAAGAVDLGIGVGMIVGALLCVLAVSALVCAYVDPPVPAAERELREALPARRNRVAIDLYTYPHLVMVTGAGLFAFGAKPTLAHLTADPNGVAATALCGGVALYLLAVNNFKRGYTGSITNPWVLASALLVALAPTATTLPAVVSLALVALIPTALVVYEINCDPGALHRTPSERRPWHLSIRSDPDGRHVMSADANADTETLEPLDPLAEQAVSLLAKAMVTSHDRDRLWKRFHNLVVDQTKELEEAPIRDALDDMERRGLHLDAVARVVHERLGE